MSKSLVFHLLRKDLRHVRVFFGLWLFFLLAQTALIGVGLRSGDMPWQIAYSVLALGIPLLQALVLVVLIPILLHDEPLTGSTAFWFTRPLSRPLLLAEKILFVLLFLVLPPLVLDAANVLFNGFAPRDALASMAQAFSASLAVILPVAAFAVVTRSFAGFILWLVVSWAVMLALGFLVQFGRMVFFPASFLAESQQQTLMLSRAFVGGACSVLGAAFVVGNQYLRRRTKVSIIAIILTGLASFAAQSLWNLDFLKRPLSAADPAIFTAETVVPSLETGRSIFASDAITFTPGREACTDVRLPLQISGVPAGYVLSILDARGALTFSNGQTVPFHSGSLLAFDVSDYLWPEAISSAIGGAVVRNSSVQDYRLFPQLLQLPTSVYQERRKDLASFQADITFAIREVAQVASLPLRPGAHFERGSRHLEIASVLRQSDGCRIVFHECSVNLLSSGSTGFALPSDDEWTILLVNRRRNEAILPDSQIHFDFSSALLRAQRPLMNRSFVREFNGRLHDRSVVKIDAAWLADAEVVFVQAPAVAILHRELLDPSFSLKSKQ